MYDVAGFKFPFGVTRSGVEGIEIAVAASEVDRVLNDKGTRQINIKRIGDCLILRLKGIETLGFEPSLSLGCKFPFG